MRVLARRAADAGDDAQDAERKLDRQVLQMKVSRRPAADRRAPAAARAARQCASGRSDSAGDRRFTTTEADGRSLDKGAGPRSPAAGAKVRNIVGGRGDLGVVLDQNQRCRVIGKRRSTAKSFSVSRGCKPAVGSSSTALTEIRAERGRQRRRWLSPVDSDFRGTVRCCQVAQLDLEQVMEPGLYLLQQ